MERMAGRYFPFGCHANYTEDEALMRERGAYVTCAYRACGLTFKTLETLERHVRLQHNLTWDAYTRYISGNSEEGEEEDETNSKKRDAYCVCTYLECGRKFKMLKSLEEHVTLYHNISWQNYTMYYHRLGKDGPDSTEDNSTGGSAPKIAPHIEKAPKVIEEPYKAPQKSVTQSTTRGPSTKAPSCVDARNKPHIPSLEQIPQQTLTANDMYTYMANVAPVQYYQDYSLVSPYVGGVPTVMADPMLWGYVSPVLHPDMMTPEQNPLNLAKPALGQRSRANQRSCDISRSKCHYESNNNLTAQNLTKNIAQSRNSYTTSEGHPMYERLVNSNILNINTRNYSNISDYDTRNMKSSRYNSEYLSPKNDSAILSGKNSFGSTCEKPLCYADYGDHMLFSDEAVLPQKQDGVIVIEPRECDYKNFSSDHNDSTKYFEGETPHSHERPELDRDSLKDYKVAEACNAPHLSLVTQSCNNGPKTVPDNHILTSPSQPCKSPNDAMRHCGIGACDQLHSHMTQASPPLLEQKELTFDVSKRRRGLLSNMSKKSQQFSRITNWAYVRYIKSRYKFWHLHKSASCVALMGNKIGKLEKKHSQKARSFLSHKSKRRKTLSPTWYGVVTRYRTAVKSYKARNEGSLEARLSKNKHLPGRVDCCAGEKMKWGSLGYLPKKNNLWENSEDLPHDRILDNDKKESKNQSKMDPKDEESDSKTNQEVVNVPTEDLGPTGPSGQPGLSGPQRKSCDEAEVSSESSSPLSIDTVDPFELNEPKTDRSGTIFCGQCKESSLTSSYFVRHLLTQHSLLRCTLCLQDCPRGGNVYRYRETLKRHLEDGHKVTCEDDLLLTKYSKRTSFAGKELKGICSIEDTDQLLATTDEKIYFSTGVAMSYKVQTALPSSGKENEVSPTLEITGIFTCKPNTDGDGRTPPTAIASTADTPPIPPRPPDGSDGDNTNNTQEKAEMVRSASTDSTDVEDPKLVIAETESCDSHSSNSNSEHFRYKGPKKRFLEGLKTGESAKSDSSPGASKPKSFNLRHCINQIIDSDAIRSRLLCKEDSPSVSQVSSPCVTAPASLENTPSHSPSPAVIRSEPVGNPTPVPAVRAGVKVRDIIQESVTASIGGNSNPSENKSEKGNPLLQMAALASMLPRQPMPGREGTPVPRTSNQSAVPLLATPKQHEQSRSIPDGSPRQPSVPHHRQYVTSQSDQRYFPQEPVNQVRNTSAPRQDHPPRYGPPPLLASPKASEKPRGIAQAQSSAYVTVSTKPQQYPSASPKQHHIAQAQRYTNAHPSATVASTTVPAKTDLNPGLMVPASYPLVAGYVFTNSSQPAPFSAVSMTVEKESPLDLSKKAAVEEEPIIISDDQPLDLSVKPTRPASQLSHPSAAPRMHSYPQHSGQGAVVKAAQTWYPRDQSGNAQNLSSRYSSHSQEVQGHPPGGSVPQRSMDANHGHHQMVSRPFKPADLSGRPLPSGMSNSSGPTRPGYVRPVVAEVRPIVSQSKVQHHRNIYSAEKGQMASPHAAAMSQGSYTSASHSPGHSRTHSPSHSSSSISHSVGYNSGSHSPGRSAVSSHSSGHPNMHRMTPTGMSHSQGHSQGYPQGHSQGYPQGLLQGHSQGHPQGHSQGHLQGHSQGHPQGHSQGHPQGHSQLHQGHPGHSVSPSQSHQMSSPQEQFLRQVQQHSQHTQHRDISANREMNQMMSNREQQLNLAAQAMRPRASSASLLLGNHPLNDILHLKCNVCNSTYGSVHSFKKHFGKAHGFEPRAEHVTVSSISAAKEVSKNETPQMADAKYPYMAAQGQSNSPSYRASPTGSNLSSPGVSAIDHSSPGPRVSPSPHNRHQEQVKPDLPKQENTSPASASKSGRTVMQCFQCGQDFPTRDWGVFKRHMRAHEMPQLRCNICRQSFRDEQEFRDHNLTYHPVQNYPCGTCGVSFGHPAALSKHVKLVHAESSETDAPNLQCLYCPHSFNSLVDLKAHIQEHERLLGISAKDSSVAQHSPQIRRASPDSTNDLDAGQGHEEKPVTVVAAGETDGAANAVPKSRSQGIPIFNLTPNAPGKTDKGDKTFRNMSIMDIVREKVEEASRRYLFDMCNKNEEKDGVLPRECDMKPNKEIAIKQEVSMEVKQEIGDKIYVMNYQEKGTVKESHVEETAVKDLGVKTESDPIPLLQENMHKDGPNEPVFLPNSTVSVSRNEADVDLKEQSLENKDILDKINGPPTPVKTVMSDLNSKSHESVTSEVTNTDNVNTFTRMGENESNRPVQVTPKDSYNQQGSVDLNDSMTSCVKTTVASVLGTWHPPPPSETEDSDKPDDITAQTTDLPSAPSDQVPDKAEPHKIIQMTGMISGIAESPSQPSPASRQVVSTPVSTAPSCQTPVALMFDDSDTDDDDCGSKLVICDDMDTDDSKEDPTEKNQGSLSSDNGFKPSNTHAGEVSPLKRPLADADATGGSPKRMKTCQDLIQFD